MKKIISMLLALVLCLSLSACGGGANIPKSTEEPTELMQASTPEAPTEIKEHSYTKELIFSPTSDLQTYTVTGLGDIPASTDIIIPATYNGHPVTAIGFSVTYGFSGPFYGYRGITSVTIPDSITAIGFRAFAECTGLTSITIPNSVTSIGVRAFENCTGLTSVTIPNSVTSIGVRAFYGCTGLTSVTIPNSVTSIEIEAFSACTGLTSITIPNSVTSIGGDAFSGCSDLVIHGTAGSYAETYANSNNIPFVAQ